jgi:hypothetical protein
MRQPLFPLTSHGDTEMGGDLSVLNGEREGRGRSTPSKLIHADGFCAAANLCRHGGEITTSSGEALLQSGHGCSNPLHHEVIRSPWRRGGPWLKTNAGRGLPSSWPLLLSGNALRTPACGGGGAQGLVCKNIYSFGVLFVIEAALSLDRTFPRARMAKVVSVNCTHHVPYE